MNNTGSALDYATKTNAGFTPEWVWGDDKKTTVYAQGYGSGHTVIFCFKHDSTRSHLSLANRIVTCYHYLEVSDPAFDKASMREELWNATRRVWPECIKDPTISDLDVVVSIDTLP
jgi:hypothetical protein